jgi:hypothetical protein
MTSEARHLKVLGNFRKLVDRISAETNYKSSNASLKAPSTRLAERHEVVWNP